jgi:hypothetical protein
MNASKKKGTKGETDLLRRFLDAGFIARRTAPTLPYDIDVHAHPSMARRVDVLATRPDRGRWLVTITLDEFLDLLRYRGYGARVESKRYRHFSLHTIFERKFGR